MSKKDEACPRSIKMPLDIVTLGVKITVEIEFCLAGG
jgi:hypothetical protein